VLRRELLRDSDTFDVMIACTYRLRSFII
jgi:hypothetical protein